MWWLWTTLEHRWKKCRFLIFLCTHMHKHVRIRAPPLRFQVFYQDDVSGHQGWTESQDFPGPYPVKWSTGNAPVNDDICPLYLWYHKDISTWCILSVDSEFFPTLLNVMQSAEFLSCLWFGWVFLSSKLGLISLFCLVCVIVCSGKMESKWHGPVMCTHTWYH